MAVIVRRASGPVEQHSLAELPRHERQRAIARTAIEASLTPLVLFGAYFVLPVSDVSAREGVLRLLGGLALFVAVLVVQLRRIATAEFPELRAVQSAAIAIPIFLIVFAALYVALSASSTAMFSEPLDQTDALYFTITAFTTVGFGDITPVETTARLLVSLQMILDLVVLGALVRLLWGAARHRLASREVEPSAVPPPPLNES